ncbi:MAG: ribbon-helix-helix protein, CopG family [Armatimonadetes bacterium]|nr:ribbon-helix-helix protein, CopG family [Armatimonadota bacterium]
MVRTQIQVSEEQSKGLKRLAKKQRISVAEVIRRSVDRTLREEYVPSQEEIWDRALKAVGCGRSGLKDVSERHDEYLADALMDWK